MSSEDLSVRRQASQGEMQPMIIWPNRRAFVSAATPMSVALLFLFATIFPLRSLGHHSQAHFSDEFSQMEGEMIAVEWRNPHIKFTLRTEAAGQDQLVNIETNSIYYLQRAGITRDRIRIGDRVVVGGYASTREGGDFLAAEMILANGDRVFLIRDGVTSQFTDEVQDTITENKGIFRVWSIPQDNRREMHTPLTGSAIAEKADFDPFDNFSTRCEPAGMPRLMWYPHPYEFVDRGSEIILRLEMYDLMRTIHMDGSVQPDDAPSSRMGYSVGRWEDNTLIVETSRLNWNYYDTRGTPQSEAAEVTERYTLSSDQSRIDYHITTIDPVNFTEPATISGYWLALGEEIEPYECEAG